MDEAYAQLVGLGFELGLVDDRYLMSELRASRSGVVSVFLFCPSRILDREEAGEEDKKPNAPIQTL